MLATPMSIPCVRRTLLGVLLALCSLCCAMAPAAVPQVTAHSRPAETAAPASVTYHLSVLFVQGPMAGNTMNGQVSGMLDSTGQLTATLASTEGATATVLGGLFTAGVSLTVQGPAGTFTLNGGGTGAAGQYGGSVSQAGTAAVGSWLLTPETVSLSYTLGVRVQSGHHRGQELRGTLAIAAESSGRFDGTLTTDDGANLVAEGRFVLGSLEITLHVPGEGLVAGVAPQRVKKILRRLYTLFSGTFIGPGSGDSGQWSATQLS